MYVFGAFSPQDGSSVIWEMPWLNRESFECFLAAFSGDEQAMGYHNILIVDNAAAHHGKSLSLPPCLSLMYLPPYSPELNPSERVWEYMKGKIAGKIFSTLDELSEALSEVVHGLSKDIISSLTSYEQILTPIYEQMST